MMALAAFVVVTVVLELLTPSEEDEHTRLEQANEQQVA